MPEPAPTSPEPPPRKSRWRYWIELFAVCLISVLVAQNVGWLMTEEGLKSANTYMDDTQKELENATPLGVYRLFNMSMSGIPDDTRPRTFNDILAEEMCNRAGDMQFIRTATATPEEGTLAYLPNGRPYCEPPVVAKPPSAVDLLKDNGLIVPGNPSFGPDLTPAPAACLTAYQKMGEVRRACLATIPGEVRFWGAKVGAYAGTFEVPLVRDGLSLLRPLAAMADVVWNGLLEWSWPAALRLMLVIMGFLLSLWLVLRFVAPDSPVAALIALVIVLPLGSLGFATGLNWAGLEIANALLAFGVKSTDLVLTMITCTAFTLSVLGKTVLMMAQEHLAEVKKQL